MVPYTTIQINPCYNAIVTTIIAVQGEGFAVICCDSRIADIDKDGYISQVSTLKEGTSKVAANGKYLLGAAGDLRAINLLHYAFVPPVVPAGLKGKKLDQFITTKFIPALRECFESHGYAMPENDAKSHIAEHASTIVVAILGCVYIIDGDYAWISDASGIHVLGTGASYALGALHVLMAKPNSKLTIQQAKSLSLKALNIVTKYDPHTAPPFNTFIQESLK